MKPLIISSVIWLISSWSTQVHCGQQPESLELATKANIDSQSLQQTREIQIYLPENYADSNKHYPVLYLLDGQRWFLQAVSLVKNFREFDYIPELIVVGVSTNDEGRWGFFNQTQQLAKFLDQEVTSYVDKHFRTSNTRLLFGWQFAGSFALSRTIAADNKFNGFIIASPFPVNGQRLTKIKHSADYLKHNQQFLFFASHPKEASVSDGTNELNQYLTELASQNLRWHYFRTGTHDDSIASSIAHRYSPINTLFHGVLAYFNDYSNLEFDTVAELQSYGGIAAVEKFYKNKGEKYGGDKRITQEGMFNLVRLAMRSDNLPLFDELLENFAQYQFLANTNLSWTGSYAEFYLKNHKFEKAAVIYKLLIDRFPQNPRPIYSLGKVFEAQHHTQKAAKQYRLAVDIAEKESDANLSVYRKALSNIQKSKTHK